MKQIVLDFTKKIYDLKITADTEITGLYRGDKDTVGRYSFKIRHDTPGFTSRVLIKAVLFNNAILELIPEITISKGAKATDSYLKIAVLLIGSEAKAEVIPGLEIKENDVKAGHAAVIGRLDQEQMFYLMSRGLSTAQAQEVLINAFILGYN